MTDREHAIRRSRGSLDRETVLRAAVELADAEGLRAITMRRVAQSLGVEAMSLYHHIPNKEALLEGLVEAVLREVGEEFSGLSRSRSDGGLASVRSRCLLARDVMLRHPWAPQLINSTPHIPFGAIAHYEAALAELISAGFSYHLGHRALHALGSMILGFVQEPFRPSGLEGDAAEDPADSAEFAALMPHLSAMVEAEVHTTQDRSLGWCDSQAEFEFTLDLLLEGLARRQAGGDT
ncbi:TetR family transcriptional regulator [Nesterenkonia sphaerica]|uniref:TetR family transcriptional regulator n=1 Tax=Nesterenkonia sphaerica TaxID=1804988 RepID=UPI001FB59703|nr:TetR family transcriptional regulator [Nesterenkonia sphaerica]